ncbi:protein FAM118A isoform X4 [Ictidomys tridecemlineatus]|uniref:protein FAM118A isoform X2 n=1 Tax=Ictidomys tridecemlineatus TaxID=43179 RepID=UPI001A9FF759|nr:protein FAM118A isoform X2 [Ictidomys tridecemlineatus]
MDSVEKTTKRNEQKSSRKFLKSLIRKQPQELLLVIGTGVSAAVAPGIPALCSWRSCIEAVIEAAEQLEVLHPGDVAEFRRKVMKDRDLLVVAHDLIRKMSPRTGDTKPNFFQDCLMEVFDSLEHHIQNPVVLQSILSLMDRGTMVLTTNYDNLLEIFGQQQNKPMESLDLKDKMKVLQWARGHIKYGVLHIHGLYTDPCGMVLDPSGYKDVTQDPEVMCPTRWTWSTTWWCSKRMKTISLSIRRICCCMELKWCPTETVSTISQDTYKTSPRRSANSEVQMLSEWTAPHYWVMHVRTVQRGSWKRMELKAQKNSDSQMMLEDLEISKTS